MTNPQPKLDPKPTAGKPARLDEAAVAAFLAGHADFFDRHTSLLAQLHLPHVFHGVAGGAAGRRAA